MAWAQKHNHRCTGQSSGDASAQSAQYSQQVHTAQSNPLQHPGRNAQKSEAAGLFQSRSARSYKPPPLKSRRSGP